MTENTGLYSRTVYAVHRADGAEGNVAGALIGIYTDAELAAEVARGQGNWGPNTDGIVVQRQAAIRDGVGPQRETFAYILDPAYATTGTRIGDAAAHRLDDDAGKKVLRDRVLRKLTESEREALGHKNWVDPERKA